MFYISCGPKGLHAYRQPSTAMVCLCVQFTGSWIQYWNPARNPQRTISRHTCAIRLALTCNRPATGI